MARMKKLGLVLLPFMFVFALTPLLAWAGEGDGSLDATGAVASSEGYAAGQSSDLVGNGQSVVDAAIHSVWAQSIAVSPEDTWTDEEAQIKYTYVVNDGKACITQAECLCYNDDYVLLDFPDTLGECPVTAIGVSEDSPLGMSWFNNLDTMVIPKSVETIYLPTLAYLSPDPNLLAFEKFSTMTFEAGSKIETLPTAFLAHSNVINVTLPEGLTSISEGMFIDCPRLHSIELPNTVTKIEKNAFRACVVLRSIDIPNSVTSIGDHAFKSCENLRSISIPGSVKSIGDFAFYNCEGLSSITLNEGLETIGNAVFTVGDEEETLTSYGQMPYSSIAIPNSVESIGYFAFVNPNLVSLQLGTSQSASKLKTLGSCAFGATSITRVVLPNSLTSLGNIAPVVGEGGRVTASGAFRSCQALQTIVWPETSTMTSVGGFDNCTALPDSVLTTLPSYFTSIAPGAFADCAFENIQIPATITSIGAGAFALGVDSEDTWRAITIDEDGGALAIGERAFAKERDGQEGETLALSEIELPQRVTSIGPGAFAGIINKDESAGGTARLYEGPTFKIYNKDVTLGSGEGEFGSATNEWPFTPGEGVTVVYPSNATDGSNILNFRAAVEAYEAGFTRNKTTFQTMKVVVKHKISGTVPAGSKVELIADGVYESVSPDAQGKFSRWKPEGTVVSVTVTVPGYKAYEISPQIPMGASQTVPLDNESATITIDKTNALVGDWSFTVNESQLTPYPKYAISGTVPSGATVKLFVGDDVIDKDGSFSGVQAIEGTVVGAVVNKDGYEPYYISPEAGKSRALLNAAWSFTVTEANMTSLSNNGSLQVTVKKDGLSSHEEAAAVAGCNIAVFDSAGALAAQGVVSTSGLFIADELPAGSYTVVGFDKNDYFSAVSSVSDFASLGLDASDYAVKPVTILARTANTVDLTVPDMDKTKLAGPVATRSMYITTAHVVPKCAFYARVSYKMNEGHAADTLTVKVPAGLEVVSVHAGNKNYDYNLSAGTLTLTLDPSDQQEALFYVGLKATAAGSYNISASVSEDVATVPLGSAEIKAPALALQVPDGALSSRTFDAVVYAEPGSTVNFTIGQTALSTAVTTNKLGYAKASLTIPEDELSSYAYYLLTAAVAGNGASEKAVLNYTYTAETTTATIKQLYFHHAGEDVYLVKNGKDVSGGYYTCLVAPWSHATLYSPTWPFTAVIDSARPLENTVTLRMETLDSNIRTEPMSLAKTENLGNGVKRYTYQASVAVGTGSVNDSLKSSDIPRAFDVLFNYDSNTAPSAPTQTVLETIKSRSMRMYTVWKADVRTSMGLNNLTNEQGKDIEDILFNGGYRHENWLDDEDGLGSLVWNVVFTAEDRAHYLEYEAAMDEIVEDMGKGYGGKSLDQYGSYENFLKDAVGFKKNQSATPAALEARGYTVIRNNNASAWSREGYYAPTWYALRADGGSTALLSGQSVGDAVGESVVAEDDTSGQVVYHYNSYQDSSGYAMSGGTIQYAAVPDYDWGSIALNTTRASVPLATMGTINNRMNESRVTQMKDMAKWLGQNQDTIPRDMWTSIFKEKFGADLSIKDIANLNIDKLDSIPQSELCRKVDPVSGTVGTALTVVGTASGMNAVDQSSRELRNVRDQRETVNGEIDNIEIQLQALRRNNELSSDLGRAYLEESQAANRYRAMLDDDAAVLTYDSLYGSLTTLGGACGDETDVAAWGISEGWELMKNNSEYRKAQTRAEIERAYEQARLKRIREAAIAADAKEQEEKRKLLYAMQPIMDPSGYVYAGVDGNRLSGVTATIYRVVNGVREENAWAAESYNQTNGQVTGGGGLYGWDVTEGQWQVVFTKAGYKEACSAVMDVPPEWTNVAINMLATDARVQSTRVNGNYIDVTFTQYMKTSAPPTVTIDGKAVTGSWVSPVTGNNKDGNPETMAKVFRVVMPSGKTPGSTMRVVVSGAESYAGVDLTMSSTQVKVPGTPPATTQTMYRLYNQWSGEHLFTLNKDEYNKLGAIGWKQEGEAWKSPTSGTKVYRLYNQYSGDHHYTTSADEYATLGRIGWTQEGVAFYSGGNRKVYRGFNPYETIGTHHYTTDANEMNAMVRNGWKGEGVGWYCY